MTWRISKAFTFEAAHELHGLPAGHKCGRLHGHSYRIELGLTSDTLDTTGFVHDFGDLGPLKQYVADVLDHHCLNEVIDQPTSEHLAAHLANWCRRHLVLRDGVTIDRVRVSETAGTWAEYQNPSVPAAQVPVFRPHGHREESP